jgi:hypothetical protein
MYNPDLFFDNKPAVILASFCHSAVTAFLISASYISMDLGTSFLPPSKNRTIDSCDNKRFHSSGSTSHSLPVIGRANFFAFKNSFG